MYMRTFILGKRDSMSASPIPDSFSLAKDGDAQDVQVNVQTQDGNQEQISAADYDPSLDSCSCSCSCNCSGAIDSDAVATYRKLRCSYGHITVIHCSCPDPV